MISFIEKLAFIFLVSRDVKILVTLPNRKGCIWPQEFMAEDLGLVFGFELVAADGAVGRAQVAWFPGFVQRAESVGDVLGQLRAGGRPGADVQSHPARVDAVLREILSFDASSGLSPLKPKVSALGLPEIQETPRSSAPGHPLAQTDLHPVCAALGPLANRSQGSDWITGAG